MQKKNENQKQVEYSFEADYNDDNISDEAAEAIVNTFMQEFDKAFKDSRTFRMAVIDVAKINWAKLSVKIMEMDGTVVLKPQSVKYQEYIKSKEWLAFRAKIIEKRGFNCEICGSQKNIQLHHLTYENFGAEREEDVMVLCKVHHEGAHGRKFGTGINLATDRWKKM